MRFAAASLLAFAVATVATPVSAHKCAVVAIEVPSSRVDAILNEPDVNREIDLAANLGNYWMAHCQSVCEDANAAVVREIARLLASPDNRFLATTMLVDVGRNLQRARSSLDLALADERAELEHARRSNPVLLSRGHILPALECIEHKLETGEVDQELCLGVLKARGAEGAQYAEGAPQ